jgi:hypothetical protein
MKARLKLRPLFSSAPAGQPPAPSQSRALRASPISRYPSECRLRTLPLPAMSPPLLSPLPAPPPIHFPLPVFSQIPAPLPTPMRFYAAAGGGVARAFTGAGTSAVGVQRGRGDRGAACGRRSKRGRGAAIGGPCRMDLPGPTASVGIRIDYSVGPWDYSACATWHLMA